MAKRIFLDPLSSDSSFFLAKKHRVCFLLCQSAVVPPPLAARVHLNIQKLKLLSESSASVVHQLNDFSHTDLNYLVSQSLQLFVFIIMPTACLLASLRADLWLDIHNGLQALESSECLASHIPAPDKCLQLHYALQRPQCLPGLQHSPTWICQSV